MKTNLLLIALSSVLLFNCGGENTNTDNETTNNENSDNVSEENNSESSEMAQNTVEGVYGIDISHYQGGEISVLEPDGDSLAFIICKATQGETYVDPDFTTNWNTGLEKGFVMGAYHFFMSDDDPTTQANFFLSTVPETSDKTLPLVVDIEGGGMDGDPNPDEVAANILTLLRALEEGRGRKPIIYTNLSTGNKYMNSEEFGEYPLWIVDYSDTDAPVLPDAWGNTGWKFWQKTDDYILDGQKNDRDMFNGNRVAFEAFIKSGN